ncbi:hypothetical protein [Vreelandella sp. H-I2]
MRIVVDANVLMQILKQGGRNDLFCPRTNQLVDRPERRAEGLLDLMKERSDRIIIPAPAFSEILVRIDEHLHHEYLQVINNTACLELISFDPISAIECARLVNNSELKQVVSSEDDKKKISFDRQIIAICVAHQADELWTHDKKMLKKAESIGLKVKSLFDITPEPEQIGFDMLSTEKTAEIVPIQRHRQDK